MGPHTHTHTQQICQTQNCSILDPTPFHLPLRLWETFLRPFKGQLSERMDPALPTGLCVQQRQQTLWNLSDGVTDSASAGLPTESLQGPSKSLLQKRLARILSTQ